MPEGVRSCAMLFDVAVIGGFGHVGLPLAIALAQRGQKVCAFDVDQRVARKISEGCMPFLDLGADEALASALSSGKLRLSLDPTSISDAEVVVIVIGTPVDRHLNPEFESMRNVIDSYMEYFRDRQLLVLR